VIGSTDMSKTEKPQDLIFSKRVHILFFLLIGVAIFLGAFALATVQSSFDKDPQVQANKDNIAFQKETIMTIQEGFLKQTNRSVENQDRIIELENYDNVITQEIGKINSKIIDVNPAKSLGQEEGQSTQSTLPTLTLKMDESEFVRGNNVIFYGMAKPNQAVILTLKLPDRSLESLAASKAMIIDGQWSANFTLRLDDALGIWQVYARQGATDQTKTLSFTVE